jgi:O-glycosyl hydrolase
MTTRYRPPTRVRNVNIPIKALTLQADPDYEAAKRKEIFYEFSNGRKFTGDNRLRGPYSDAGN